MDRPGVSSALFFKYNTALGPPYRVIVDTNFINFSIQNKVFMLFLSSVANIFDLYHAHMFIIGLDFGLVQGNNFGEWQVANNPFLCGII